MKIGGGKKENIYLFVHLTFTERLIKPDTRIFDVISKWESYGITMTERNIPTAFSFLFKRFLFLNENAEPNAVERELDFHQVILLFIFILYVIYFVNIWQVKTEIHKGYLPCREEDATKLAALLYSMEYVTYICNKQIG